MGFPGGSGGKESACKAGDLGLIPGSGRSSREGNGNPLQYSCLKSSRTEEPGRLQCMGWQRVGHDLATKPPPCIGCTKERWKVIEREGIGADGNLYCGVY